MLFLEVAERKRLGKPLPKDVNEMQQMMMDPAFQRKIKSSRGKIK